MDYNSRATKLETLSREDLKRAAKILKLKGFGNKNKTELISAIMEAGKKISSAEYNAEAAILKVREAMGLSTSGNLKSRTAGLRKSKIDDKKSPKELAAEAMRAVAAALSATNRKPKLNKQFKMKIKKELDDFEASME